jgi:glutamate synthase (NADPH) large chain
VVRKRAESEIAASGIEDANVFHIPSLSCRTIVYKGLLLAPQITNFYKELSDPDVTSALCLVHQRFSTNTFPSWQRAHPYRYIAHNGEINTLKGNVNWMHARQSLLQSPLFGDDVQKALSHHCARWQRFRELRQCRRTSGAGGAQPAARHGHADSGSVGGKPHMKPEKRAFYEYHACLMEPWDGPAAIAFTDGRVIGAILDRNGLRPGRYVVTQ